MDRLKLFCLVSWLGVLVTPIASLQAAQDQPSVDSRIAQLEQQIEELNSRLQQGTPQFEAFETDYDEPSEAWGTVAAYESTYLIYHRGSGSLGAPAARVQDSEYLFAPRMWFSYTGPTGLGLRARYWDLNEQLNPVTVDAITSTLTIDDSVFDLDLTCWIEVGQYWSMQISGGWRYVDFEETRRSTRTAFQPFDQTIIWKSVNTGGSLGAEFYAHVTPVTSFFATGRASIVFGDHVANTPGSVEFDVVRPMWESQLGIETRVIYESAEVFARLAGEVQYWDNFSGGFREEKSSIGFAGVTTAFGILF